MDEEYLHREYGVYYDKNGNLKHDPQWQEWADNNPPVLGFEREIAPYLPKEGEVPSQMAQEIVVKLARHYLDTCMDIIESRQMYRVLLRLGYSPFVMKYAWLTYEQLLKECGNLEVRRYCEVCHMPQYFQPYAIPARILCEPCRAEHTRNNPSLNTLRYMDYHDYLKTHHWFRIRDAAIERAGHRCQVCNSEEQLQVHHRTYERRGEESPGDVIVLCAQCHRIFHQNRGTQP